jgi:hypothetical protein
MQGNKMKNEKDLNFKLNFKGINYKKEFRLDLENFDKDFVPIPLGIPYVQQLMQYMKELYPEVKMFDFMKFPDDPSIVARALILDPSKEPEIFFVCERHAPHAPHAQPKMDVYFIRKYFDEITTHILAQRDTNLGKAH